MDNDERERERQRTRLRTWNTADSLKPMRPTPDKILTPQDKGIPAGRVIFVKHWLPEKISLMVELKKYEAVELKVSEVLRARRESVSFADAAKLAILSRVPHAIQAPATPDITGALDFAVSYDTQSRSSREKKPAVRRGEPISDRRQRGKRSWQVLTWFRLWPLSCRCNGDVCDWRWRTNDLHSCFFHCRQKSGVVCVQRQRVNGVASQSHIAK